MRIIEYVLWTIVTLFSLLIVRVLYKRNSTPIEKIVFGTVAGLVFVFLIGAFWFSTGRKLDIAYEAILCPLSPISLSSCELPLGERERKEQAKPERGREKQAMLERTKLEREREERAKLERERKERARLEREREEQARLEREREERVRLERERKERTKLERGREERAKLERERKERARLEREREEQARLEREREEEQRRSQRFAAMAVGISGRRLFAITARDMPSYADAEAGALARCNQEVSNCRIEATFSGAGKCGYAAAGAAHAPLFGSPDIRGGVRTGPTATEAIERCEAVFQKCYIFHTSCNSP